MQALGHFISTFADSGITGLLHNNNGEIVITDPEALAHRLDELEEQRLNNPPVQIRADNPATNPLKQTDSNPGSGLAEQTSGNSEAAGDSNEENSQPVSS